jgi:hypothetical protein
MELVMYCNIARLCSYFHYAYDLQSHSFTEMEGATDTELHVDTFLNITRRLA